MGGTDWIKKDLDAWGTLGQEGKDRLCLKKEVKQRWGRQEVRKRKRNRAGPGRAGDSPQYGWVGAQREMPQQTQWISVVSFILVLLGQRQCRLGWYDLIRHHCTYSTRVCFSCVAMHSSQQFQAEHSSSTPPYPKPWRRGAFWNEGFFRC